MRHHRWILLGLVWIVTFALTSTGQDLSNQPNVVPALIEPDRALQLIRGPKDIAVSLFAAEPRLANPVAFTIDAKGRFYVVETFRLKDGVTDDRTHMEWLDDDLASRTVADREKMMLKWLGKDVADYAVQQERIHRIEDRDGDGKADHDNVFADGFSRIVDGIAAGALVHKGDVYFTCIPDLWLLKDTTGSGDADVCKSLSSGYGVHVSFIGHDLHGLIIGPDGRLYFSIGDRGLHVVTKEGKVIACPDTGAVLRCNLDGSNLELFATGLRNPQELAFDNFGNLFTVDNNSDSGDKARVVYLVEGGDSGWRIGYQYIESPVSRGPWNAEKLWYPAPQNTGAFIVPPLMNLSDGPSGLTFDPGVTLMPSRYKDHFFLADFRGGFAQSGIRSFAVEPSGASFKVVDPQQPFWSVLATDVDFGTDGALYVSDWVDGWDKTGKGRIWRFADPSKQGDKAVKEVQTLLAGGMTGKSVDDLAKLLGHADRRVRQMAQFEMADRAGADEETQNRLMRMAESKAFSRLERLHALWALDQTARHRGSIPKTYETIQTDSDPEIRAQAAKLIGEVKPPDAGARASLATSLLPMLDDASPRVAFFAAQSLGKIGDRVGVKPLFELLRKNADQDPYLRHAAVMGLVGMNDSEALSAASADPSPSVRLGAVLALRRLGRAEQHRFLNDQEPKIVLEAARGIYDDDPKPGEAMKALADLAASNSGGEPTLKRVVNANARLGGKPRAEALVGVATREGVPTPIRVEALALLGDWAKPSVLDRVTGLWRPYPARPRAEAADSVKARLDDLLKPGDESVHRAVVEIVGHLAITEAVPPLIALIGDPRISSLTQVAALKALEEIGDPRLAEAVTTAIAANEAAVRSEGRRLLTKTDPARAIAEFGKVLMSGSTSEQQSALAVLAGLAKPEADSLIAQHLKSNDLPREVELDLLEAAEKRSNTYEIKSAIGARTGSASSSDPLAGYHGILYGGDAVKGRRLFERNSAVYCIRCHKVKGEGGEVGPDLSGIGAKQSREYIATSIVHPNNAIAQGFETVVVALADGKVISGVFKSENDTTLNLMTVDDRLLAIPKSEIDERKRGPSAMPEDVAKKLKKSNLRDLVEFRQRLASSRSQCDHAM